MKRIFLAVALFGVMTSISAQQRVELTLDKALELAMSDNPTMKIDQMEIERYDYVEKEAIGNLLPQLSAGVGYTHNIIQQKLGGSISISGDNQFAGQVQLNLPIFAPAAWANVQLSREQMLAAVETARGSKIELQSEVTKSFYNILLAEQSLEVLLASEKTLTESANYTTSMYEAGLASEYDYLTAQVQLNNVKPTIIETRSMLEVAKMLLKVYLNIPESVEVAVSGELTIEGLGGDNASSDVSENSQIRSLEIQRQMMNTQFKLLRASRMPTIAAVSNFQIVGEDLNMGAFGAFTGGAPMPASNYKYNWQRPWTAGVQMSIPLFAGTINIQKERSLKNQMNQLNLQLEYLEQSTSVQAQNAINQITSAKEQVKANQLTVSQAQKAYEIANVRYKAGSGTILDLSNAQLQLVQAQLNHTQAMYDVIVAQTDYNKIIGKQ